MTGITIDFDDAQLQGTGSAEVERGTLFADGSRTVEKGDVLYLELREARLFFHDLRQEPQDLDPGHFVICKGGLFRRVLPAQ